jgi:predicted nuclease of predicted toxin-antitoxin system
MIMTARKKKSKKRFDASFGEKPPDPLTFFLDRALGKKFIAEALSNPNLNIKVEVQDDYFEHNTTDEEWLKFVGERGWTVFTKDKKIRYRAVVLEIVRREKVRMFILSRGNLSGPEMAQIIINALPKIRKFIFKHPPPFIVSITRSGNLLPIKLRGIKD